MLINNLTKSDHGFLDGFRSNWSKKPIASFFNAHYRDLLPEKKGYDPPTVSRKSETGSEVRRLCELAISKSPVVIMTAPAPMYTSGRAILDELHNSLLWPSGYSVVHILFNTRLFGIPQSVRKHVMIATQLDNDLNISPPKLNPRKVVLYDKLKALCHNETYAADLRYTDEYGGHSYQELSKPAQLILPELPSGWTASALRKYRPDRFPSSWNEETERDLLRLQWKCFCPCLDGGDVWPIHPQQHRPLTVAELAAIYGWSELPMGPDPYKQIVEGGYPAVGNWLKRQLLKHLEAPYADKCYNLKYEVATRKWVGQNYKERPLERLFDFSKYYGAVYHESTYDLSDLFYYRIRMGSGPVCRARF